MHVNEARREGHAGAVDRLMSVPARAIADNCDVSIVSGDIGDKRRRTEPVKDLGMRENRV